MRSLFKTVGAVLCLIFALCFAAPNAHADSYTATFTCTGTCVAPLPTAPDVSFPTADLAVTVTWNSELFSLLISNSPKPNDFFIWIADESPGNNSFEIEDDFSGKLSIQFLSCPSCTAAFADVGRVTFSPVATPEPGSLALILSGVGLLFAMRKRSSPLQHAS
jgi:hypothetical protein